MYHYGVGGLLVMLHRVVLFEQGELDKTLFGMDRARNHGIVMSASSGMGICAV